MGLITSHESHLILALLLNALVLWSAWRVARRVNDDLLDAAGDALLLFYLVQYVSVCLPGLLNSLHPLTIAAVAVLISAAMGVVGLWRTTRTFRPPVGIAGLRSQFAFTASILFVVGYLLALIWHQRQVPVMSNDAITYHLPAAVQWLQTGTLGFYEAWFYNPANSYSPLAGSTFIAWLIAPMGNDVLARFVQLGPLLLLFVAMVNLCRRLGADVGIASMVAAATVLARPFVSQTILAKDDLFVAAFFVLAVDALTRARLETRVGAWRAGIALGLLLATKYTVLLSLPIFALTLNRAMNWRRIGIIAACVVILAGPWYWRNIILTGNPLYPTFGMLNVHRSDLLATPAGAWNVFTGGYYGIPAILACIVIAGWLASFGSLRDPLRRTVMLGPAIGIALFVALAPYGEMRFAYPSLALMFAAGGLALTRLPGRAAIAVTAIALLISAGTAFKLEWAKAFVGAGAILATFGAAFVLTHHRGLNIRPALTGFAALVTLALGLYGYVYWRWYVEQIALDAPLAWRESYGPIADGWAFVREHIPPGSTVAYTNTYFIYPLMGFAYDHRVVHVPTRHNLERFVDMPRIAKRMTGEEIVGNVVAMLREQPDREQWHSRLRASGAEYLIVSKQLKEADDSRPIELEFLAGTTPMFENEAAAVFRIN